MTAATTLSDFCNQAAQLVNGRVVHLSPRVGIVQAADGRSVELAGPLTRNWVERNHKILARLA